MTIELYRNANDGRELHTLAKWHRGDDLETWLKDLGRIMQRMRCPGFHCHTAVIRNSAGKIMKKWRGQPGRPIS